MKSFALLTLVALVINLNATDSAIPPFSKSHSDTKISANNGTILTERDSENSIHTEVPIIRDVDGDLDARDNLMDSVYLNSNNSIDESGSVKIMAATKNNKKRKIKTKNPKSQNTNKKLSAQSEILSGVVSKHSHKSNVKGTVKHWLEILTQAYIVNNHMMNLERNYSDNEKNIEKLRSLRDKLTEKLQKFLLIDNNSIVMGSANESESEGALKKTELPI